MEKNYDLLTESGGYKPDLVMIGKNVLANLLEDEKFKDYMDDYGRTKKHFLLMKTWNNQPYPQIIGEIVKRSHIKYLGIIFIYKDIPLFLFTDWENKNHIPEDNIIMGNAKNQNFL